MFPEAALVSELIGLCGPWGWLSSTAGVAQLADVGVVTSLNVCSRGRRGTARASLLPVKVGADFDGFQA